LEITLGNFEETDAEATPGWMNRTCPVAWMNDRRQIQAQVTSAQRATGLGGDKDAAEAQIGRFTR